MDPSVQVCVKRRFRSEEGFFDVGRIIVAGNADERRSAKEKLAEIISRWIAEDEEVSTISALPQIDLNKVVGSIKNRVCHIAGHTWVEYGQCIDGETLPIHAAALRESTLKVCGELAEFLPDIDEMLESVNLPQSLAPNDLTPDAAWTIVSKLFESPNRHGTLGVVPGTAVRYARDQIDSMPTFWLTDRHGAKVSPRWIVAPDKIQNLTMYFPEADSYSYTPDHHPKAENCLTWTAKVLDQLVGQTWFRQYSKWSSEGDHITDEVTIRTTGRMSLIEPYAERADQVRLSHPVFDSDDRAVEDNR